MRFPNSEYILKAEPAEFPGWEVRQIGVKSIYNGKMTKMEKIGEKRRTG